MQGGHLKVCELLLASGVDPDESAERTTALDVAVSLSHLEARNPKGFFSQSSSSSLQRYLWGCCKVPETLKAAPKVLNPTPNPRALFWGSLFSLEYNLPQNPILIIKAPVLTCAPEVVEALEAKQARRYQELPAARRKVAASTSFRGALESFPRPSRRSGRGVPATAVSEAQYLYLHLYLHLYQLYHLHHLHHLYHLYHLYRLHHLYHLDHLYHL